MIRAVIFDMDGVMIDSEMEYLKFLCQFARQKNPKVRMEDLYGTVGTTKRDCWEVVERAVHTGETWQELREQYKDRWKDIFKILDYQAIFRPEVLTVMDELLEDGYRLAAASSTNLEQVKRILALNQVDKRLELMVSGGMFKRSKPDPEIYLHTAGELGLKPGECMAVEDSTVGITAGHRAGMKVAALIDERFGFDRRLADYELHSLTEIPGLLRGLKSEQI